VTDSGARGRIGVTDSALIEVTTLGDLLVAAARTWPDADAIVFPEDRRTYRELLSAAVFRARSLRAMGVSAGDHVGILMPNLIEFVEILFGIELIGAVAVPINARYKETELGYVIENAEIEVLMTTDVIEEHVDFVDLLHRSVAGLSSAEDPHRLRLAAAPCLRAVVVHGDSRPSGMVPWHEFESAADDVDATEVEALRGRVAVRDVCIMMYTSGTTASPKGCPLTHEALVRSARAMSRDRFQLTPADRFWDPLPMFHMSAILPITAVIDTGGAFLSMTHVEPSAGIDLMIAEGATALFPSFPTLTAELVHHPRWSEVDVSLIRVVNNVAPPATLVEFQAAFPDAVQVSAYGLTEATGVVSFGELTDDLEARTESCGRPFPGIEVRVVDPDTGAALSADERGELVIRGYCLFEGYYRDPQATADVVDADGWLHTGDVGSLDSFGRIRYHGRYKDMLKVGGENVAAVEIESFLGDHPAVKLVQVVAADDEKYQEVPVAFVELHDGATATADELIGFCHDKIAAFKVPRHVRFVDEWPMSATKIQKFRLREMIAAELAARD
jgi:acyl-CoA synthetase (AMP-forming)/AMP-acid ligase II